VSEAPARKVNGSVAPISKRKLYDTRVSARGPDQAESNSDQGRIRPSRSTTASTALKIALLADLWLESESEKERLAHLKEDRGGHGANEPP
jgi:hypothetical protein